MIKKIFIREEVHHINQYKNVFNFFYKVNSYP